MALLKGNVRQIYFRYLGAAFGSALISSIYGLVDSAMVGQYQGPEGTAALAIVAPVWNIIYSLGLLTGIGGSVLLSAARGAGRQKEGDEYFTAALAGTVFFAAVSWLAIAFFDAPLLRLFGARDALLPLAQQYLLPVKFVVPLFLFNQMLAAFLRNDGAPGLATAAVLASPVKLPTTAMSKALKSCSKMAVAATGRAKRGILLQMGPCSMSSCRFAGVSKVDRLFSDALGHHRMDINHSTVLGS